ncbi:DUF1643 domain-containing protein [Streptomyces sp. AC1-42T]|uniref:DUF1643 domain-containing protein n=1 Tax=Streptomyces sp. AC1-42T TaxID=2218665 RepID=UPI000DACC507|nr:DUF1643 domain-containing protein [Streptomyces sp. AC1-42T]PZT71406.1 hypothetical protein DNK55_32350 [Streptomyces sp. AC1-42T]
MTGTAVAARPVPQSLVPHGLVHEEHRSEAGLAAAVLSADRAYRYLLSRIWDTARPPLGLVMLNPSTADAHVDDRTIGRCTAFARREEAGGLLVVNLFALRATKPRPALTEADDPVGPYNDSFIRHAAGVCETLVAAWGSHGALRDRGRQVTDLLWDQGAALRCLGTTGSGHPRHPLYLPGTTPLRPYAPPHL